MQSSRSTVMSACEFVRSSLCQGSQFDGPKAVDMLRITGLPLARRSGTSTNTNGQAMR